MESSHYCLDFALKHQSVLGKLYVAFGAAVDLKKTELQSMKLMDNIHSLV